jgi:hypothetical protein
VSAAVVVSNVGWGGVLLSKVMLIAKVDGCARMKLELGVKKVLAGLGRTCM